jgi:integrase
LIWSDLDAALICAFLDYCEKERHNTPRTRNLRLTAIRSFFRYASFLEPAESLRIQQILATPNKRQSRRLIGFLTHTEVEHLLAAPDQTTWSGRRDHTFLLLAVQIGMRLSEVTALHRHDLVLGTGAHVHCWGKGRKNDVLHLPSGSSKFYTAGFGSRPMGTMTSCFQTHAVDG